MVTNTSCPADGIFQGKDANEEFHFSFHQHWIRMLWPICKLLISSALIIGIGYLVLVQIGVESPSLRRGLLVALALLFTISQAEFLSRFYRYFLYVIIVTDKRIHRIKKTLLTVDDHQSMDLWMLQDIYKCQHGILQNMLGYGSLILEAQETMLRLHFVPNVSKKYGQLMRLRERARTSLAYSAKARSNSYMQKSNAESTKRDQKTVYLQHASPVA